jgi:hypothetical protein
MVSSSSQIYKHSRRTEQPCFVRRARAVKQLKQHIPDNEVPYKCIRLRIAMPLMLFSWLVPLGARRRPSRSEECARLQGVVCAFRSDGWQYLTEASCQTRGRTRDKSQIAAVKRAAEETLREPICSFVFAGFSARSLRLCQNVSQILWISFQIRPSTPDTSSWETSPSSQVTTCGGSDCGRTLTSCRTIARSRRRFQSQRCAETLCHNGRAAARRSNSARKGSAGSDKSCQNYLGRLTRYCSAIVATGIGESTLSLVTGKHPLKEKQDISRST